MVQTITKLALGVITLAHTDSLRRTDPQRPPPGSRQKAGTMCVLVVDDDPDVVRCFVTAHHELGKDYEYVFSVSLGLGRDACLPHVR